MIDMYKKDCLIISGKKNIKRWTYFINSDKLNNYIELNHMRRNIYNSVNKYIEDVKSENIIFEKIFLDFDENPYENTSKVLKYLLKNNISFSLLFSGRGYHIFIKVKKIFWKPNLSLKIKYYVKELMDKTNAECDMQVVGDLNRVSRVPNTINTKTKLYCIPLTTTEFFKCGHEGIKKLALKRRDVNSIKYNGKSVDIGSVEVPIKTETFIYDKQLTISNYGKVFILPPCLQKILERKDLGYFERFLIILYYRDLGYSIKETEEFLKESLTESKYEHCVHEENQVKYLYGREDIIFPNCETLEIEGRCVDGCKGNNLYL